MSDSLNLSNANLAQLSRPRDFGRKRQHPLRRFGGIAVAVVLHILLIWALINGLATKVVKVVTQPITVHIIEPVKPPPPPPPPPPKVVRLVQQPKAVPPPFVPPPEVHVQSPPAPTITHQDVVTPSAPVHEAPPPAAAPVTRPVSHEVGVACPNSDEIRSSMVYPQEAQDNDITGEVTVEFTVDADGNVTSPKIVQHADLILERAAVSTVKRFHCIGQGQVVRVQVPFSFKLN